MKVKLNIKGVLVLSIVTVIITSIGLFFINTSFAANTAKVTVDTANLREKPDSEAKILDLINKGENIEVIETSGEWYKVKHNNITGYVRKDLIKLENQTTNINAENTITNTTIQNKETNNQDVSNNQEEQNAKKTTEQEGKYKIVEDTTLKVIPLIHSLDITNISKETQVEVINVMNNWGYVKIEDKQGWAILEKMQKIEETQNTETSQKQENEAKKEEIKQEQKAEETKKTTETNTQSKTMYVNSNSINVRSNADKNSSVVTQISINTAVEVISQENGWSKVKVSGKQGYVLSTLLSDRKQETSRGTTQARKTNTNKPISTINVQNRNNTESQKSSTSNATQNTVTAGSGTSTSTGSSVVEYAKQFIGIKYTYGGSSPSTGFDCSGFTSYVYKNFGISLPRTSGGQSGVGTAVSRENLLPGDLVLYSGHVAIYVGGGNVIHAPRAGKTVCIVPLNQAAHSGFLGGRRIV